MATLKNDMRHFALSNITDNDTKRSYCHNINHFCTWLEERDGRKRKMKDLKGEKRDLINEYSDYLQRRGLSSHSIHTYLAPICKAFQIKMDKVSKPVRKAADVTRGRMADANLQGKREAQMERYARSVGFQRGVGIRRAELGDLTVGDLTEDESGELCVVVKQGKGGKRQLQVILPKYRDAVRRVFAAAAAAGKDQDTKLFMEKEMKNHIDYHALRAELAREAYRYYLAEVTAGNKEELKERLVARWNACHEEKYQIQKNSYGKYEPVEEKDTAKTVKFCRELNNDEEYILRGDNRRKAMADGALGHYDRVALLCVSVFHLSHWRNDVTTSHYMI